MGLFCCLAVFGLVSGLVWLAEGRREGRERIGLSCRPDRSEGTGCHNGCSGPYGGRGRGKRVEGGLGTWSRSGVASFVVWSGEAFL